MATLNLLTTALKHFELHGELERVRCHLDMGVISPNRGKCSSISFVRLIKEYLQVSDVWNLHAVEGYLADFRQNFIAIPEEDNTGVPDLNLWDPSGTPSSQRYLRHWGVLVLYGHLILRQDWKFF